MRRHEADRPLRRALWLAGALGLALVMLSCSSTGRADGESAADLIGRGDAKKARGDQLGALADYDEAIRRDPEAHLAYLRRAWIKEQKGDVDGALADCSEAIRLSPEDARAYVGRGELRRRKGETEAAIEDAARHAHRHSRRLVAATPPATALAPVPERR